MWGGTDDVQAVEAMQAGFDHGITSVDTAPIYGLGHSEKMVGKFIKEVGRDKVEILTKYGWNWKMDKGEYVMDGAEPGGPSRKVYSYAGRDGIRMEVEDSLRRLGTDYIDLYQIHRPDAMTPIEETMEEMEKLKVEGKIRAVGVSNHRVDLMKRAMQLTDLVSSQSPYSMVYKKIEKDILPFAIENHIGILAYSPLQRGLLTGKMTSDHKFDEGDHRPRTKFFKEPNRARTNQFLQRIKPIADEYGATLAQLVINWTVQKEGISGTLVGARNARQAGENARSLDFQLSSYEIDKINAELAKLHIEEV